MDAAYFSKISVPTYQTTRCHYPEEISKFLEVKSSHVTHLRSLSGTCICVGVAVAIPLPTVA
jgi:hypothetical protein